VAVNFALTWDARASTRTGTRSDFSSPLDKRRLLELRASADAVLVGRTTLEAERMTMGIPDDLRAARVERGRPPAPLRVVVSASGRIDAAQPIFLTAFAPILLFSTTQMPQATRMELEKSHAESQSRSGVILHLSEGRELDLREMLATLWSRYGVRRVVCEGGPTLLRSLLEENLVDEINLTFCPRIFGGTDAPTLTGGPGAFLPGALECRLEAMETVGGECFACYRVIRSG